MTMRLLQLDSATLGRIATVRDYALANPYTVADMQAIMDGDLPPAGLDENRVVHIHDGYRCVFSIDSNGQGLHLRHLSVSITDPRGGRPYPSPIAVSMLLEAFGFDVCDCASEHLLVTQDTDPHTPTISVHEFLPVEAGALH